METVSFRLDEDLRSSLEDEARAVGVSLNALTSHVLHLHSSWGQFASRLGLIPVSKDLLRSMFEKMSPEDITGVAREAAVSSGTEHILFLFQQISLVTMLRFLDLWRVHFDASQHRVESRRHYFTIHHDVNRKYSFFIKEYVNTIIQSAAPRPVHFETVSPNAVTFSFED